MLLRFVRAQVLLACLVFVTGVVQAQVPAAETGPVSLDPAKTLTQFPMDAWTAADGLPQNQVSYITQDDEGYLWLLTMEGLVRFDGQQFSQPPGIGDLPRMMTGRMHRAADGTLWLASERDGLLRYRDGERTRFGEAQGLSYRIVFALHAASDGTIWAGTDGGLIRYSDGDVTQWTTADGLPGIDVYAVASASDGTLIVGTHEGLVRFDGTTFEPIVPGLQDAVRKLLPTRSGDLWIGSESGLWHYSDGVLEAIGPSHALRGSYVTALYESAAGTVWIATNGGLHRYEGEMRAGQASFSWIGTPHGLGASPIISIYEDREGSLWLGSEIDGLRRLKELPFSHIARPEGLTVDHTWVVYQTRDGALWAGTQFGLNRYAEGNVTTYTSQNGLENSQVFAVYEDRHGTVWVGTPGGLYRVRDGVVEAADFAQQVRVGSILEDENGVLWVATSNGLYRREGGTLQHLTAADGLPSDAARLLYKDTTGRLWLATRRGLGHLDTDGTYHPFTHHPTLQKEAMLSLGGDNDGNVWVTTLGNGIFRFHPERPEQVDHFTKAGGLPSDQSYTFLDDGQGYLWMSSNLGIHKVAKADLDAYTVGTLDTLVVRTFDERDGLRNREANGGTQHAGFRLVDGRLMFATVRGIALVDPADLGSGAVPPNVHIDAVRIDGEAHPAAEPLMLEYGSYNVGFAYSGISLLVPERVTYQYRLEGVDAEWVEAGAQRFVQYSNLRPGTYTFRVRARNMEGDWQEAEPYQVQIRPIYTEASFMIGALIVLLLIGGLVAFLRNRRLRMQQRDLERLVAERTRDLRAEKERTEEALCIIRAQADQLREVDQLKTQFFNNISHELRTPLTLTLGPLENVLAGSHGEVAPPARRQLNIMLRHARRLLMLINQLLDLSKLESERMTLQTRPRALATFVEGITYSFTAFAEARQITIGFDDASEASTLYYDMEKLEKVFYNLLSNAIKFTPERGHIDVRVYPSEQTRPDGTPAHLSVAVSDTGIGIPSSELPHIFDRFRQVARQGSEVQKGTGIGLSLVNELVGLHGGSVDVTSVEGEGTTFIVHLPTGTDHLQPDEIAASKESEQPEAQHVSAQLREEAGLDAEEQAGVVLPGPDADAPLVLVVDDNPDIREYVAECINHVYRVATAVNGEDALARIDALRPDLVVSDVMMPGIDGYALCQKLKQNPRHSHLPIILLTAKASVDMKVEGLASGADDYMAKPFQAEELRARIKNLLQLRAQEKELKELNDHLEQKVQAQFQQLVAERQAYEAELLGAKERAEASARLKTAMLNNMSHEFRTPLTGILGSIQVLGQEVSGDLAEFATYIQQNGQRLMDTLNAVLELSELEAGEAPLQSRPLTLSDHLGDVLATARATAAAKELHFDANLAPNLRAQADAHAVQRILHHLLDNAIKFTANGSVAVTSGREGARVWLRVTDTGSGIPKEQHDRIFNAFEQGSSGLSRAHEGSGLGLTVARTFARHLGGDLTLTSSVGTGTTFTLWLPAASSSREPVPPSRNAVQSSTGMPH